MMCEVCGRGGGAAGARLATLLEADAAPAPGAVSPRFRAIVPGAQVPNYVLPGALDHAAGPATPTASLDVTDESLRGGAGRVARSGVQGDRSPEQPAWGFGFAPAASSTSPVATLTLLPVDPAGFTERQQDAVRRDVGALLGDAINYTPEPFAGS